MEAGVSTAQAAAQGIIERDPILGGIAVLLALALVAVVVFGWRAIVKVNEKNDALYDRLIESEIKHQTDIAAVNNQRSSEIATLAKIAESYAGKGR